MNATEGDGGTIIYSIVAGDTDRFEIDAITGLITTLQPLDREDINRHILTVQARDTPGTNALSSFAQVQYNTVSCVSTCIVQYVHSTVVMCVFTSQVEVTVADVNDNAPQFSQEQYEFNLQEHSPIGEALPIVIASDSDIGSNALLSYSISTGAGQFVVNSATGV